MSVRQVLINLPGGAQTHFRADTCEALGIRPGETIGQRLYDLAASEDYRRDRADAKWEGRA